MDDLERIPTLEVPGLEEALPRLDELEARMDQIERRMNNTANASGTMLSGLIPGGMIYDRVAEVRAAVKVLAEDPANPHSASTRALLALNWGQLSVED